MTTIRCAHGDTALYPLAEVELEVEGRRIVVEAAISETLPMSVLLGTDVTELKELLGSPKRDDALAVVTRAEAKRRQEQGSVQKQKQDELGVAPRALEPSSIPEVEEEIGEQSPETPSGRTLEETGEEAEASWMQFDDSLFSKGRERLNQ